MASDWINPKARSIMVKVGGLDMENPEHEGWRVRRSDRHTWRPSSSPDPLRLPSPKVKPKTKESLGSKISLPHEPPQVPPASSAFQLKPPGVPKGNSSPFNQSHMKSSHAGPSNRNVPDSNPRKPHDKFLPTPPGNFYPPTQHVTNSKYFPPEKDARNPNSFLPPTRPASPPAAGPSRVAVTGNKPIQTKKSRPQREPSAPIDLVSESEDDDETPEPIEQRRMAMPSKAAVSQVGSHDAGARARRPDSLSQENLARLEMPSAQHSAKRKRSPSDSSYNDAHALGNDEIEDFDDRPDPDTILVRAPPSKPAGPVKRARMQDKNGNSSAINRNLEAEEGLLLGETVGYHHNGKDSFTKAEKLYLRPDRIQYCTIGFKWEKVIQLLLPTPSSRETYSLGVIYQRVIEGSEIHAHCWELSIQTLTEKHRTCIRDMFHRMNKSQVAGGIRVQCEQLTSAEIPKLVVHKAKDFRDTSIGSPPSSGQQKLPQIWDKAGGTDQRPSPQVRPQPKTVAQRTAAAQAQVTRRSNRAAVVEDRADREVALQSMPPKPRNPDKVLCRWPPTGRMELEITAGDYYRLHDDEFLNDTLIDFGLRYIVERRLPAKPADATLKADTRSGLDRLCSEDVFVFNPFFYNRLSAKTRGPGRTGDAFARDPYPDWAPYNSVKKWTNKVDIFSKKFIIVPVNENLHWYMAVIYNPGVLLDDPSFLRGDTPPAEDGSARPLTRSVGKDEDAEDIANVLMTLSQGGSGAAETPRSLSRSPIAQITSGVDAVISPDSQPIVADRDTIVLQRDAAQTAEPLAEPETRIAALPTAPSPVTAGQAMDIEPPAAASSPADRDLGQDPLSPIEIVDHDHIDFQRRGLIMTFDSLGSAHPAVSATLNRWLVYEARDKKQVDLSWGMRKQKPLGYKSVNVPPQRNFSDCGIYCLHFMEVLLEDPVGMMGFIYQSMLKKDQLNGTVLEDYRTRWQSENALEGRAKWRKIISGMSDGVSSPENRTNGSALPSSGANGSQDSAIEMLSSQTPDQGQNANSERPPEPSERIVYKERTASDPNSFLPPLRPHPSRPAVPQALPPDLRAPTHPVTPVLVSLQSRDTYEVMDETEAGVSVLTSVVTTSSSGATAGTDIPTSSTTQIGSGMQELHIHSADMHHTMDVDPALDELAEDHTVPSSQPVEDGRILRLPSIPMEEEAEAEVPAEAEMEDSQDVIEVAPPASETNRMRQQAKSKRSYTNRDLRQQAASTERTHPSTMTATAQPDRETIQLSDQPRTYTTTQNVKQITKKKTREAQSLSDHSAVPINVDASNEPSSSREQRATTRAAQAALPQRPETVASPERSKPKRGRKPKHKPELSDNEEFKIM